MSTRFIYLRDFSNAQPGTKGTPVGCVAMSYDSKRISYAISVCSPYDVFDKTVARQIAAARLTEVENPRTHRHRFSIEVADAEVKHDLLVKLVMEDIKKNNAEYLVHRHPDGTKYGRSFVGVMSARAWLNKPVVKDQKNESKE